MTNAWCNSGLSLSNDGTTVAICATGNDNSSCNGAGHVRVYRWLVGGWTQLGADIDGEGEWDSLGWAVSLSNDGNLLACSSKVNDDGPGDDAGKVRVFQYDKNTTSFPGIIDTQAKFEAINTGDTIYMYLANELSLIHI